ncbi:MAG TPA: MlaD family protein, partial [Rubricoccaceae bacterium]
MSRQARLGLVVLLGLIAAAGFMFVIASQGNLLARTFKLRASFERVAGLKEGASVFYNGIAVGRVEEVALPDAPGEPIMVRMQVEERARNLIREDSRALIQTDGLVGNVIVALTDGTRDTPQIAEDGQITGVDPFDLSQVSDRLFTSVSRFDSVTVQLAGIMTDVRTGEGSLGRFLYDERLYDESVATTQELQLTLRNLSARADGLLAVADQASNGINSILQKVNSGDGTVARFLNEDEVYTTFLATATQLQQSAAQFQTVAADARGITDRFQNAAGWASLGAFRFSENMEALKHNFLFRS